MYECWLKTTNDIFQSQPRTKVLAWAQYCYDLYQVLNYEFLITFLIVYINQTCEPQ